ncbi:MAG: isocitrate/isopropylmalate dehydrogenase family protein [Nitrospinae bacterium]|nr:isocitrate/isopropylmalate dehydrogenase family protein [Nitrospinota bacterium]
MSVDVIERAKEHFGRLMELQLARVERIKQAPDWLDFSAVSPIIVGIIGGDGIGPYIAKEARWLLEELLKEEISNGKVELRDVEGLTIERRAEVGKPIPDEVLEDIKKCHVTLKGPTTTPRKGDPWPNIESANVALRKELDLFANVRPVKVPAEGIDWIFFRENTEGAYALGPDGIDVTEDLAVDFCAVTSQGTERLIRLAFDYAKKNEIPKVTLVTKANVVKTTDGKFLDIGYRIAEEYPDVECDDWYIDIMAAKLIDPKRRTDFRVMALPNLYGDILTDEAAEFQGGVGTVGSANIGRVYSMFEAIHGSAPRMVKEGRVQYADPSSMIRAGAMLIRHIGFVDLADKLEMALDVCGQYEKRHVITGRDTGCTGREFAAYIMETIQDTEIEKRWSEYVKAVA